MQYVYIQSEPGLWTVGFYGLDEKFIAESDHDTTEKAAKRVRFLNGGNDPTAQLRDQFAGQALAGLLAARWETSVRGGATPEPVMFDGGLNRPADDMAGAAYELADAMLRARG
jgi:hypothetical protein